jgi:hypothetical protein
MIQQTKKKGKIKENPREVKPGIIPCLTAHQNGRQRILMR